eukprot:TRINITY_DN41795_c0_g1_i1.p1 TRINITY_DN41795_c0_g1~~TRINITY_DN41795_c0_g1_i1.p1  ORF type:complete len:643 (-),score=97.59 TRINITY_DN41795_c0_g1_i1:686-2614(-)
MYLSHGMSAALHLPRSWELLLLGLFGTALEVDAQYENCESGYWQTVQQTLASHIEPSLEVIVQLVAAETALEDPVEGAGCEVGRLVLSTWQLVYSEAEERAEYLNQRFGAGFYNLNWRPQQDWRIFLPLLRLREQLARDAPGMYESSHCDELRGEEEGQRAAEKAFNAAVGSEMMRGTIATLASLGTPAAQFLLEADRRSMCPLAIGVAFWTMAAGAMLPAVMKSKEAPTSGGSDIVEGLWSMFQKGAEAAKAWRKRPSSFSDLLTSSWPLLDLGLLFENFVHDEAKSGNHHIARPLVEKWGSSRDPLEPHCPQPDRKALAEQLKDQRIEAVVVFGRREKVEILHRYLLRNARSNGGVLDRVMWVVFWATTDDLNYLNEIVAENSPYYSIPPVTGRRLAKFYSVCTEPETIYIKIDDDVVYISDSTIPEMVLERQRDRCAFVSANVVNHAILSSLHQDIGALRNFFPQEQAGGDELPDPNKKKLPWIRDDAAPPLSAVTRHAQSDCVWKLWECAAWMHESLLSRLEDGTECAYDFGWYDFHAHGHGSYRGDRFIPLPYSRWSINMIAFRASDLTEADFDDLAEDDESELSYMVPHRMNRRACAVGRALIAHFTYSRQEDRGGVEGHTNLLERYLNLSRTLDI